jgi:hypothetical protein
LPSSTRWRRLVAAAAIALLVCADSARAQGVRTRILEGLQVARRPGGYELVIRFTTPVRYLRHSPLGEAQEINVTIEARRVGAVDARALAHRESLRLPPELAIPLVAIDYEGDRDDQPVVNVRFSRKVAFRVKQGDDFRSLQIELPMIGPAAYAIQLGSSDSPELERAIPAPAAISGKELYAVPAGGRDADRQLFRVGFFATRTEAETALAQIASRIPGAFVIEVNVAELRGASAHRVAAERLFIAPPVAREETESDLLLGEARKEAGQEAKPPSPMLAEARKAISKGELDRAVLALSALLSGPETPETPDARELLALVRERKGQLAHAKADYEEYLRAYPEGPGAERVRQRLAALATARAAAPPPRQEEPAREPWKPKGELFGSVSGLYRRDSSITGEEGELVDQSALQGDLFVEARGQLGRLDLRSQLSGGYLYDFVQGTAGDELRVSSLFTELSDRSLGTALSVGRRSQSDAGVLGRYDGARLTQRFDGDYELGLTGGFPVDLSTSTAFETERYFAGVNADASWLDGALESQLFFLHQMAESRVDRSAVGAELRYFADGLQGFALVDYDVHFQSLNLAQLVGGWQVSDASFLHFTADYRNSPILMLTNALQGQGVDDLDSLRLLLTGGETLGDLARDRTARALTFGAGGSYRLTPKLELALDVTASRLGSMPASLTGPVAEFPSTGFEFFYLAQLVANDLWLDGDLGIVGLRFIDGDTRDALRLSLDARFPIWQELRFRPSLDLEYRFQDAPVADELELTPALRFDYRLWRSLYLDAQAGLQARLRSGSTDDLGYFSELTARFDF